MPPSAPSYPPTASNSPRWFELSSGGLGAPSVRDQVALAYDPATASVILFGGYDPTVSADGDTWSFANGTWTPIVTGAASTPPARWGASLAWDPADGYLLLFGGRNTTQFFNDTWSFNGSTWTLVPTTAAPSPREYMALTFDATDGYLLASGGGYGNVPAGSGSAWSYANDTWSYANGTWTNLTASSGETGLVLWSAYDAATGSVVAIGTPSDAPNTVGCTLGSYTWTYSGGTWTNLSASASTPGASFPAVAYDTATSSVVLFGGYAFSSGCASTNETWSYAAGAWSNVTGPMAPLPREAASATYDPALAAVILFGGTVSQWGIYLDDVWAFGTSPLVAAASASPTSGVAPLTVNFTGSAAAGVPPYNATWAFGDGSAAGFGFNASHTYTTAGSFAATLTVQDASGNVSVASVGITVSNASGGGGIGANTTTRWTDLTSRLATSPEPRDMAAMAYDPALGAVVLFGGYSPYVYPYGDTWLFSNGTWTDVSGLLLNSPAARWGDRMVWDAADGYLLLFGGRNLTEFFNDTWAFTGATWKLVSTTHAPSPRAFYEFAYDAADNYTILYGGGEGNLPARSFSTWANYADTWSYANGSWTNLTSSVTGAAPGPRLNGAMVYDARDGYTLLYGGVPAGHPAGTCLPLGYTFTYLGGRWTNISGSVRAAPPPLSSASMDYSSGDGAVFLFGGTTPSGSWCASTGGSYEYANGTWTNLTGTPSPSDRDEAAIAYDAATNESVLFGGNLEGDSSAAGYYNDTWVFTNNRSQTGSAGGSGGGNSGGGGTPLNVSASESATAGSSPLSVQFTAVVVGGAAPYTITWSFGDGNAAASGARTQHVFAVAGVFVPEVAVTDAQGHAATVRLASVSVSAPSPGLPSSTTANGAGSSPLVSAYYLLAGAAAGAIASAGLIDFRRRARRDREETERMMESLRSSDGPSPASEHAR